MTPHKTTTLTPNTRTYIAVLRLLEVDEDDALCVDIDEHIAPLHVTMHDLE
jgi:hypothetical protein